MNRIKTFPKYPALDGLKFITNESLESFDWGFQPEKGFAFLYLLFDGKELVYIGKTINPSRPLMHKQQGKIFDKVYFRHTKVDVSDRYKSEDEERLIKSIPTRYNVCHIAKAAFSDVRAARIAARRQKIQQRIDEERDSWVASTGAVHELEQAIQILSGEPLEMETAYGKLTNYYRIDRLTEYEPLKVAI